MVNMGPWAWGIPWVGPWQYTTVLPTRYTPYPGYTDHQPVQYTVVQGYG